MYLKRSFSIVLMSLSIVFAFGQIQLINSSFEGGSGGELCGTGQAPMGWSLCENGAGYCIIDSFATELIPDSAFDERYAAFITVEGNTYNGAFGQWLNCGLIAGYQYSFSLALALVWANTVPSFYKPGPVSIYIGNNTCSYDEEIFLSPILDTIWKIYRIEFTPIINEYALIFRGVSNSISINYNVDIDALSPIAVINAHQIHAYQQDTVLPIGSNICVNLNAYADAVYRNVWWEQEGVGVISNQLNAGVYCVDSSTTFIVHIMGSDSTCAGYLPSSDTLRVKFYDPNGVNEISNSLIAVYPNPASSQLFIESNTATITEINIYNTAGGLVSQTKQPVTKIINISLLANGVYIAEIKTKEGSVKRRWVKM